MFNDPIADLLTRIRNAIKRNKKDVSVPKSNMVEEIVKILVEEGYLSEYSVIEDGELKNINMILKYREDGEAAINHLKRVSKPGLRIYRRYREIPKVLNGLGINIFSTPKGIMTGKEAITQKVGGEYICNIW